LFPIHTEKPELFTELPMQITPVEEGKVYKL
jgi:hypothetical protein